jgi:diadenosine tetraphosphate (Ap4A) HIT family hydrolase
MADIGHCLFFSISPERVIADNELSYAIQDGFPVTDGHNLCNSQAPCGGLLRLVLWETTGM